MAAAFWMLNLAIEDRRRLKLMRRHLRDVSDPFNVPELQFRKLYRLSKECAIDLCNTLRPYIPQEQRSTAIPLELKVLATLNFIASGSYQRRVGQDFLSCMSQASVSGQVHTVVEALNQVMDQWIKFPMIEQEIRAVKQQFWDNCHFPGIIGAIDGTHIAIWPPEVEREYLYINRKLYHSLNVMLICDSNEKILAVNAGHGGRTHDSRVWNASVIFQHLEQEHRNGRTGAWLIGDSGYPLFPYLLTPMLNQPVGTPSATYTKVHVKARCVIERCIGVLKGRWRCLKKERALHYKPEFAALIVNAACVLHNIAKQYNVPEPDLYVDEIDQEDDDFPREINNDRGRAGQQVREAVIRRYFT